MGRKAHVPLFGRREGVIGAGHRFFSISEKCQQRVPPGLRPVANCRQVSRQNPPS
ncbi:hypothetical protein CCACVL1_15954 [Corchorus capsularis]|uniref:Uncharacterized protein n=2 Tax=Corchorus TaxID=93758 RepID=A0A1R3I0D3_COCAP|nr:hypothetical protein COLO4_35668 [Corchorus olitorius]OMO76030.1 hypothetical protein CCACVL1_15954 [Corchorus capsularis]